MGGWIDTHKSMIRMITGGASGADWEWASAAICAGYEVDIISFPGHTRKVPVGCNVIQLSMTELMSTDAAVAEVARYINRRIPMVGYVKSLIRRNMHIVDRADVIYAVTAIRSEIPGGTAWGCARSQLSDKRLYIYDMTTKRWVTRRGDGWEGCTPPPPYGVCALIGARELTPDGKAAIWELFK